MKNKSIFRVLLVFALGLIVSSSGFTEEEVGALIIYSDFKDNKYRVIRCDDIVLKNRFVGACRLPNGKSSSFDVEGVLSIVFLRRDSHYRIVGRRDYKAKRALLVNKEFLLDTEFANIHSEADCLPARVQLARMEAIITQAPAAASHLQAPLAKLKNIVERFQAGDIKENNIWYTRQEYQLKQERAAAERRRIKEEKERKVAEAQERARKLEEARVAEERRREEAQRREKMRIEEEKRKREEARIAQEKREAELQQLAIQERARERALEEKKILLLRKDQLLEQGFAAKVSLEKSFETLNALRKKMLRQDEKAAQAGEKLGDQVSRVAIDLMKKLADHEIVTVFGRSRARRLFRESLDVYLFRFQDGGEGGALLVDRASPLEKGGQTVLLKFSDSTQLQLVDGDGFEIKADLFRMASEREAELYRAYAAALKEKRALERAIEHHESRVDVFKAEVTELEREIEEIDRKVFNTE